MLRVIPPPATIGMLGGGQLGRFALMAARSMGYGCVVLDPDPRAPAGAVADEHLVAAFDDPAALDRLAVACDVVTTEFENPPAASLDRLAGSVLVAPSAAAVAIAQDRLAEKAFLTDHGFPVGPHAALLRDGHDEVDPSVGFPVLVKTARLGYDGKGQLPAATAADLGAAWAELGGVDCVVERRLDIELELSVVVARTADARVACFPVAENAHVDGILDVSVVPARVEPDVADRAVGLAMAIADALDYVGVMAVELFLVAGELLVNELAPRPHNSGHWTIDGARTSQFEQQVRAIAGVGLGSTAMTAPGVAMANLLGDLWERGEPHWEAVFDDPDATLHLYGKAVPRPGRKMGHVTVRADDPDVAETRVRQLRLNLAGR